MSHRIEQVESTLKKTIAQVLQRDLADPRVDAFVSITRVKVSPDFADATVFVSVMPAEKQSKNIHGLKSAAGHIRSLVLKKTALRAVPRLRFEADESLKKQAAVYDAIRRANEKTRPDDADDTTEPQPHNPADPGAEDGTK
jgi:ribosome-binding factor A